MSDEELNEVIIRYRESLEKLQDEVQERFPIGTKVFVNCSGRYRGPGISSGIGSCAESVAVTLPNGNVWDYPIRSVSRIL